LTWLGRGVRVGGRRALQLRDSAGLPGVEAPYPVTSFTVTARAFRGDGHLQRDT